MNTLPIQVEYNRLKLQGKQLHSNYFFQDTGEIIGQYQSPSTYIFYCYEPTFYRLFYITNDFTDFTNSLKNLAPDKPFVMELLHTDPDYSATIEETIKPSELLKRAEFNRMECKKFRDFDISSTPDYATENDLNSVHKLLFEVFDPIIDHLPSPQLLLEHIKNKNVLVYRNEGEIKGFLVFQINKKKAHFNFLYNNATDPMDSVSLIGQFYTILKDHNVNESYLWVEKNNKNVIKIHKLFGYTNDGLVNYIFTNAPRS